MPTSNFEGIQYKYNTSNFDYCDCWGIVDLWYRSNDLYLPIETKDFYQKFTAHNDISLKAIWKLKGTNLKEVKYLYNNAILMGVGDGGLGFGVWVKERHAVLTINVYGFSRFDTWGTWLSNFTVTRILMSSTLAEVTSQTSQDSLL